MSGIEIAGLLLGGFPLLISAVENYKEGFKPLRRWKRFRTDFTGFIDAVDLERYLFEQTLDRLLLSAGFPETELGLFKDPGFQGWQQQEIIDMLETALGSSRAAYMNTLKTMGRLMEELQNMLSLKDGKVDWASEGASKWDFQLKRISLSFGTKGTDTLELLESHNRKLKDLLDSNEKLGYMKTTRQTAVRTGFFSGMKRLAVNLHSAVRKSWTCDCDEPHSTALRLQQRDSGSSSPTSFSLLFAIREMSNGSGTINRMVVAKLRNERGSETTICRTTQTGSWNKMPSDGRYLNTLRQDFRPRSATEINASSAPMLQSIASSPSLSTNKNGSALRPALAPKSNSSACTTEAPAKFEGRKTGWFISNKPKLKKTVRMDIPLREGFIESQPPIPPQTESIKIDPHGVCVEITNFCSLQWSPSPIAPCIGHLSFGQESYELQYREESTELPDLDNQPITLETLLMKQREIRFGRGDRFKVASILASSLLQLQSSPWLADRLDKKQILFPRQGSQVLTQRPYIRHQFPSIKASQTVPPTTQPQTPFQVRASLSKLGILLLELCFGETIESQPLRSQHLAADGTPHEWTDIMTSHKWADLVYKEEPELEGPINCCVFGSFQEKADWENPKFMEAVYVNVVEPLDRFSMKWKDD